jgi:bifunctional DNA-binding transcriptional regulator/antitoxin component of YhaV-PrlF toxin-antitoxin module
MGEEVKRRRRRGYTRLSGKHQATIPVDAMAKAGLRPGDELRVTAEGLGRVVLEREGPAAHDWIERFAGSLPGFMTQEELQELRAEWDA